MRITVAVLISITCFITTWTGLAQQPDSTTTCEFEGIKYAKCRGWYFRLVALQPSAYIHFDLLEDEDDTKKADFFNDGSVLDDDRRKLNLQVLGVDYLYKRRRNSHMELGMTASIGIGGVVSGNDDDPADIAREGDAPLDESRFLLLSAGTVLQWRRIVRFETGLAVGITSKESFDRPYDVAYYIGIIVPTALGNTLGDIFK